jgi:hypothetical protein
MTDFSNLKALDVDGETLREYVFPYIPGEPSVFVAPATDVNKAFLNERLRLSIERSAAAEKQPRGKGSAPPTPDSMAKELDEAREVDRVLLARTCAKRWGVAPTDAAGKQPEFSEANCLAFFKALPDWMFDPLRNFCGNIYNFVTLPGTTEEQAGALGES